jgi:predicted GIY-YIG superfamily endonuclease
VLRAVPTDFQLAALGICVAFGLGVPEEKRFVNILRSDDSEPHFYIGLTHDVRARLADHSTGRCPHTARYRPWTLHVTIELPDAQRALAFERYLKSGSGRALRSATSVERCCDHDDQLPQKSAVPPLIAALDNDDPSNRVLVIYALEALHAKGSGAASPDISE